MSLKTKLVGGESGQHQSSSPNEGDNKSIVSSGGDRNGGEWFGRADHPLLNDVVLAMIFDYLRGNYLKTCRLVNKKWNISTLPFSRFRLQVRIFGTHSFSEIDKFMKVMSSNTLGNPFGRFNFGSFDTTQGFVQEFLQLFGNTTKSLTLNYRGDYKVESISELLRSMPNLESFEMASEISSRGGGVVQLFPGTKPNLKFLKCLSVGIESVHEKRIKYCPSFYEELLGAAPNILTLVVTTEFLRENDAGIEVLEALEKLGRESTIENLKFPQVDAKIATLLRKMTSKGMKLKRLEFHVRIRGSAQNLIDWLELVSIFKNSLISLTIGVHTFVDRISIIFPTMPKLIQLTLMTSGNTNSSCENFTNTFPALQELRFCIKRQEFINLITGDKSSTMKSLTLYYTPKMNMDMFNRILSVFPALTRLDCELRQEDGAEIIRNIWTHMTQLQALDIRGTLPSSENLDSLVTGIPVQEIEKMCVSDLFCSLEQTTTKIERKNILERMMMHKHELPSITNLTDLRSLSLNLTPSNSTDLTAYFGLYTIKTLRHLSVPQSQFSMYCCETLVKELGLMTWSFRPPIHLNIIPPRLNLVDKFEFVHRNWEQYRHILKSPNENVSTDFQ